MDIGALRKHILTNIDDFLTLKPPWANVLRIWCIFKPNWPLVTNWGQLEIFLANAKALYPFILHFGGLWDIEAAYFEKY